MPPCRLAVQPFSHAAAQPLCPSNHQLRSPSQAAAHPHNPVSVQPPSLILKSEKEALRLGACLPISGSNPIALCRLPEMGLVPCVSLHVAPFGPKRAWPESFSSSEEELLPLPLLVLGTGGGTVQFGSNMVATCLATCSLVNRAEPRELEGCSALLSIFASWLRGEARDPSLPRGCMDQGAAANPDPDILLVGVFSAFTPCPSPSRPVGSSEVPAPSSTRTSAAGSSSDRPLALRIAFQTSRIAATI
eukprot:CAMPEP_0184328756 /NCGR_PEP_ID=MMETSP1049-20130417/143790_1 /TAXON_ID=77928 /ORGANISM="Proteomonas sulcata, Strain CCMP704" /LENGTH=246 /DNA_ID=CAMNT_0026651085 /DNA_START=1417 /DNA_END=2156 /DNA_ORIENTATION=-